MRRSAASYTQTASVCLSTSIRLTAAGKAALPVQNFVLRASSFSACRESCERSEDDHDTEAHDATSHRNSPVVRTNVTTLLFLLSARTFTTSCLFPERQPERWFR